MMLQLRLFALLYTSSLWTLVPAKTLEAPLQAKEEQTSPTPGPTTSSQLADDATVAAASTGFGGDYLILEPGVVDDEADEDSTEDIGGFGSDYSILGRSADGAGRPEAGFVFDQTGDFEAEMAPGAPREGFSAHVHNGDFVLTGNTPAVTPGRRQGNGAAARQQGNDIVRQDVFGGPIDDLFGGSPPDVPNLPMIPNIPNLPMIPGLPTVVGVPAPTGGVPTVQAPIAFPPNIFLPPVLLPPAPTVGVPAPTGGVPTVSAPTAFPPSIFQPPGPLPPAPTVAGPGPLVPTFPAPTSITIPPALLPPVFLPNVPVPPPVVAAPIFIPNIPVPIPQPVGTPIVITTIPPALLPPDFRPPTVPVAAPTIVIATIPPALLRPVFLPPTAPVGGPTRSERTKPTSERRSRRSRSEKGTGRGSESERSGKGSESGKGMGMGKRKMGGKMGRSGKMGYSSSKGSKGESSHHHDDDSNGSSGKMGHSSGKGYGSKSESSRHYDDDDHYDDDHYDDDHYDDHHYDDDHYFYYYSGSRSESHHGKMGHSGSGKMGHSSSKGESERSHHYDDDHHYDDFYYDDDHHYDDDYYSGGKGSSSKNSHHYDHHHSERRSSGSYYSEGSGKGHRSHSGRRSTVARGIIYVTNRAPRSGGTCHTPVWIGVHDGSFDLYNRGQRVSSPLEALAEDGNAGPLMDTFANSAVFDGVVGGAPICPGDTAELPFEFTVVPRVTHYLSYASMILPSNDAFVANGDPRAHVLFGSNGRFQPVDFTVWGSQVLDAGSEVNDELPRNTAFFGQENPNTGVDENGVVRRHPGFLPRGSGGILDDARFSNGDFTRRGYKVLTVCVALQGEEGRCRRSHSGSKSHY